METTSKSDENYNIAICQTLKLDKFSLSLIWTEKAQYWLNSIDFEEYSKDGWRFFIRMIDSRQLAVKSYSKRKKRNFKMKTISAMKIPTIFSLWNSTIVQEKLKLSLFK